LGYRNKMEKGISMAVAGMAVKQALLTAALNWPYRKP